MSSNSVIEEAGVHHCSLGTVKWFMGGKIALQQMPFYSSWCNVGIWYMLVCSYVKIVSILNIYFYYVVLACLHLLLTTALSRTDGMSRFS